MQLDVKNLLKNKVVLFVVLFFAITNVLGYMMLSNFNAVVMFVAVGLLASYFSKNMIVILLVALIATNAFVGSTPTKREGMAHGKDHSDKEEATEGKKEVGKASKDDESKTSVSGAVKAAASSKHHAGATGSDAHHHKGPGKASHGGGAHSDGSAAMHGADPAALGKAVDLLEKIEPLVGRATKMMEGLESGSNKIGGMLSRLGQMKDGLA